MKKVYCANCRERANYFVRKNIIKEYKGYEVNVSDTEKLSNLRK